MAKSSLWALGVLYSPPRHITWGPTVYSMAFWEMSLNIPVSFDGMNDQVNTYN